MAQNKKRRRRRRMRKRTRNRLILAGGILVVLFILYLGYEFLRVVFLDFGKLSSFLYA